MAIKFIDFEIIQNKHTIIVYESELLGPILTLVHTKPIRERGILELVLFTGGSTDKIGIYTII